MARSYDIADLEPSDGVLTDQIRRKINGNFRRLVQIVSTERPAAEQAGATAFVQRVAEAVAESVLEERIPQLEQEIWDSSYPVGCVIVTATTSDPRLSHGTWEQVGGGRYVRAAGGDVTVLDEGGSDEVTLTEANLPEHTHDVTATAQYAGSHAHSASTASAGSHAHTANSAGAHQHNVGVDYDGEGSGTSNGCATVHKSGSSGAQHQVKVASAGAHTHSTTSAGSHAHAVTVQSAGSHTHVIEVDVAPSGSAQPDPIEVEPSWVGLLFYRRVA